MTKETDECRKAYIETVAESIIRASGSDLNYYMPKTKTEILIACENAIMASCTDLLDAIIKEMETLQPQYPNDSIYRMAFFDGLDGTRTIIRKHRGK